MKYVPLLNKTEPQKISCKNPNFHFFFFLSHILHHLASIPTYQQSQGANQPCPLPPEHELRLNYKPNGIWGRGLVMGKEKEEKINLKSYVVTVSLIKQQGKEINLMKCGTKLLSGQV